MEQKYKNLPADVQEDLNSFMTALQDEKTSNEDKSFFESAIAGIEKQFADLIVDEVKEQNVYTENVEKQLNVENKTILSNGNFYKKNPDKLLGTIKTDKSRYGKDIQVLIGDISVLNLIDADTSVLIDKQTEIAVSTIELTATEKIESVENKEFIEQIITKSES